MKTKPFKPTPKCKASYKRRAAAALKFIDRELDRIKKAYYHFDREAREKKIEPIYFEDRWKHPNQQRDFIRRALVELPAVGHDVAKIQLVLKTILRDGRIPSMRDEE